MLTLTPKWPGICAAVADGAAIGAARNKDWLFMIIFGGCVVIDCFEIGVG